MQVKNSFDARKRNLGSKPVTKKRKWRRALITTAIVILLLLGLLLGTAIWHSLTHVTTVRAAVHAAIRRVASDVDARIEKLYVRTGDHVTQGQPLARLDDTPLRAALAAAEADKAICQSELAQAKARVRVIDAQCRADIELMQAQIEMAKRRIASADIALAMRRQRIPEEIRRAQAYRDEAAARLQYLKKGARREEIEVARARLATARARESLRKFQVKQTETLVARHVESPLELEVIKTELHTQSNEVREAELRLQQLLAGPTSDQIEATRQALEAREAALTLVQTREEELPVLAAELAIRKSELSKAKTALKRAEAKRYDVAVAQERVKAAEAQLERAAADGAERSALLKRMTLVSPVTGTVIRIFNHEGEICRKGVRTLLVTDDTSGRWIEGHVREDDAALLKEGQTASVELVMGSGNYVTATVEAVGLLTAAMDNEDEAVSSKNYAALVWVKLKPVSDMGNVRPGMSAQAVINVNQ